MVDPQVMENAISNFQNNISGGGLTVRAEAMLFDTYKEVEHLLVEGALDVDKAHHTVGHLEKILERNPAMFMLAIMWYIHNQYIEPEGVAV